jgi:putative heme transporter
VADELPVPTLRRGLGEAVRYVLGVLVGIVVILLLFGKRGELVAASDELSHVSLGWVVAAIAAESLSLLSFAYLQRHVLALTGIRLRLASLYVLTLANDAIANTVPGEPAVSSAYRYRYYRRSGATGASAGWTVFTILIAQAIGMSLLLLLGVLVALAGSTSSGGTGATVVGLFIVLGAGVVLVRRDVVLRLAGALVRGLQRLTGRPDGSIGTRVTATLARMREIPLSTRSTLAIVAIAAAVWGCDFLCLVCSFGAVHARIPWDGVLLAYGVAQIIASVPVVPGGIGIVEGSLAVILAAYGAGRVPAFAAAIAFRIVNFWLAIAIGWISVGVLARQVRRGRAHDQD